MTHEEAARILDPETSRDALAEIEYYGGFRGEGAVLEAVNEACRIAAEVLKHGASHHAGDPLTLEQLQGVEKVTPVWWEGAGFWCLAQSGGILTPSGQCYDVDGLPGEFYASPPAHIDREEWTAEWRELHGDKLVGLDDCGDDVYRHYHYSVCTSCGKGSAVKSNFCPKCGKAMTPEAWAELEKRLRG